MRETAFFAAGSFSGLHAQPPEGIAKFNDPDTAGQSDPLLLHA
jgi:hypothetical protein